MQYPKTAGEWLAMAIVLKFSEAQNSVNDIFGPRNRYNNSFPLDA